jgi:hypothetical protein
MLYCCIKRFWATEHGAGCENGEATDLLSGEHCSCDDVFNSGPHCNIEVCFDREFTCDCDKTLDEANRTIYSSENCELDGCDRANATAETLCSGRGQLVPYDATCECECDDGYAEPDCLAPTSSDASKNSHTNIVVGGSFGFVILTVLVGLALKRQRTYKRKMAAFDFTAEVARLQELGELEAMHSENDDVPREIPREDVTTTRKLGEGAFGEVWEAVLDESRQGGVPAHQVACVQVGQVRQQRRCG